MKKEKIRVRRPKRRIPVAPPRKRHKSDKDYDRKKEKEQTEEQLNEEGDALSNCVPYLWN